MSTTMADKRKRTLTEKGIENKERRFRNDRIMALAAVTRKRTQLHSLIANPDNLHLVKSGLEELEGLWEIYLACTDQCLKVVTEQESRILRNQHDKRNEAYENFRKELDTYIEDCELNLMEKLSSQSESPSSRTSSKASTTSSIRSARVKERARLAELLVEKDLLKKKQELQSLELELSIAKAKARERVYAEAEGMNPADVQPTTFTGTQVGTAPMVSHQQPTVSGLNPVADEFYPVPLIHSGPQSIPLIESQTQLAAAMCLPSTVIKHFNGDPMEYTAFIMTFEARIIPYTRTERDKLYYLDQHLQGEPKDLIAGCMYMDPAIGYSAARDLLAKEYGDPYKIAASHISTILSHPPLRAENSASLKNLYLVLNKCKSSMKSNEHMTVLNHAPNMQATVAKLPMFLQNKWRDHAYRIRQTYSRPASFADLVDFVRDAAEAANDPIYNREALQPKDANKKTYEKKPNRKPRTTSFAITTSEKQDSPSIKGSEANVCQLCKGDHDLDDCKEFSKKTLDERREFVKQNKLCFGCYGYKHNSKNCTNKRKCKICNRNHPTGLHDPNFQGVKPKTPKKPDDVSNLVEDSVASRSCKISDSCVEVVLQSILPVKVRQIGSQKVATTYAFYDNGSTGCFMTRDLMQTLGAKSSDASLKSQTMHGTQVVFTKAVEDIIVMDENQSNEIRLPKTYIDDEIPVDRNQIPDPDVLKKYEKMKEIAKVIQPYYPSLEVGLLVGSNCPKALRPLEVLPTDNEGPFAVRLHHGWTVNGPLKVKLNAERDITIQSYRILFRESHRMSENILQMFEMDFSEKDTGTVPNERAYSHEDLKFMDIVDNGTKFLNGHYEIPLPFKQPDLTFPNNKIQAEKRAFWQKRKMKTSQKYEEDYNQFMSSLITKGHAVKVPTQKTNTEEGKVWYLPHHGVYHPRKPDKIRIVFDCSAKFGRTSLNDGLLQGPDLTNSLVGVLTRFRQEPIAFMADVEAMFYQVNVPEHQQDFLRFLWWPNGDLEEYKMTVHLFGARSSPSVANYALRKTAESCVNAEVAETIRKNFYVDDCLKSVKDEETAVRLISELRSTCKSGGFRLTKFVCANENVSKSIPREDLTNVSQTNVLDNSEVKITRALGIQWDIDSDTFIFSVVQNDKPATRRGILSIIASVYDPLGFVAPFVLPAKKVLQELCQGTLHWDEEIPRPQALRWEKWVNELQMLQKLRIKRCLKPKEYDLITSTQLHLFSDASSTGYGVVAYLRTCDTTGNTHMAFLMGKSRLAPIKQTTIPRLELTAATVAVEVAQVLKRELDLGLKDEDITYHTDSMAVLYYIRNEQKRFPVFVANRLRTIRDFSEPTQWRYVETKLNPADTASRGSDGKRFTEDIQWFQGPEFLKQPESAWPQQPEILVQQESSDDSAAVFRTIAETADDPTMTLLQYYSNWHKLKKAVAVYRRLQVILQHRSPQEKNKTPKPEFSSCFTVDELNKAEDVIIKYVQGKVFQRELNMLKEEVDQTKRRRKRGRVSKDSSIYRLDPFVEEGILRVGGRLSRANIDRDMKYPILLPHKDHITTLILRDIHENLAHAGRNHTLSAARKKFWVIKGNSAVRTIIAKCITCRRYKAPQLQQKMADLPEERVNPAPPFTYTGVDLFGPTIIKEGRKELKKYGVLFTCLASRAIHIETANSLDTDSFICALRRFIARRGCIKELFCDNGSNFVGAERELKLALNEMDQDKLQSYLAKQQIKWKFNPPAASHMGGIWERMIQTVKKTLAPLLKEFGERLDDESYRTLLCEVETIVNSRPLTTMSDDPNEPEPLTPSQLLHLKSTVILPPPGNFQRKDVYMRKRWRRVQYLSNLFWSRWKKEYLVSLQTRQKWTEPQRNLKCGDVVLVKDESSARNKWPLGLVTRTYPDSQGHVRSVTLKTKQSELSRPIHKLVLLVPTQSEEE